MLALRNLLLFALGLSIPLVMYTGYSVYTEAGPVSAWCIYALWGYVVCMMADAYFQLKEDK